MTSERVRQVSTWTTIGLVAVIVALTLFLSPAEGDPLSRLLPGTIPLIGGSDGYDTCLGGLSCQDGHALAFIALGISLTMQVLTGRRGTRVVLLAAGVLLLLVLFATADELAQRWAGRNASLDDWLADVSGGVLGMVIGGQLARLFSPDAAR